ncbi:uroporphyrinogen-III synthase [Geomicrobium sp. JSM 1781026]|uniref:uroporphyrinogen-III synthase n=1 Tax=Geomicrobium sp. JSM 1781026 TaxID=3344580 RepID=UPI0035BED58D
MSRAVIVTRGKKEGEKDNLVQAIEQVGIAACHFPLVELQRLHTEQRLPNPTEIDRIIFTSANAVSFFLQQVELDYTAVKVAAVGKKTSRAAEQAGFTVDVVASVGNENAEGLLEVLRKKLLPGERILFPKSKQARLMLEQELQRFAVHVQAVSVYETVATHAEMDVWRQHVHHPVVFTSPSAVSAYEQMMSHMKIIPAKTIAFVIGPVTEQRALRTGFSKVIAAPQATFESLATTICTYLNREGSQ